MTEAADSILIIEDEAQIRRFLQIALSAHGWEIIEARTAEQGHELCAERLPVLVILDLGLPDMDGIELIRRLREWSAVPVLVLSVRADEAEKVAALDAGANDYVTKPFGIAELIARIRVLLRNNQSQTAPEPVFSQSDLYVDFSQRHVSLAGDDIHLTRKEYDLLRLLVSEPGRVLTHQQIMREIWGDKRDMDTQHLRVLVASLRQKLGDDPTRPRYIMTETGIGYRFNMTA